MASDGRFNPDEYLSLVRAALDPDERKFFKQYVGQDAPGFMDYVLPQGRFAQARGIREKIVSNVLTQALQPKATVGEAQALFPGFPTPPGAMKLGFADDPTGDQGIPLPGGPAPAQQPFSGEVGAIPLGGPSVQSSRPPLVPNRPTSIAGQPNLQGLAMETPQPGDMSQFVGTSQDATPVPAPSAIPPMVNRPDPDAILPPSFQAYLNAQIDASKHPRQGQSLNEATMKMMHQQRIAQLRSGQPEQYPGETRDLEQFLGFYDKAPVPGSPAERKLTAEATTAEAKAPFAAAKEKSSLAVDKSQIKANEAKAGRDTADMQETNMLMRARLENVLARTQLAQMQGGKVGQDLSNAEARIRLMEAGKLLDLTKLMEGLEQIDAKGVQEMYKHIASSVAPDLELVGEDPNAFQKLFNLTPKGMTAKPRAGGTQAPALTPPPAAQPQAPAAPQQDVKAKAKALYDSLKEGETGTINGQKYRKKGGKLERVN